MVHKNDYRCTWINSPLDEAPRNGEGNQGERDNPDQQLRYFAKGSDSFLDPALKVSVAQ